MNMIIEPKSHRLQGISETGLVPRYKKEQLFWAIRTTLV